MEMLPLGVNLTALLTRLTMDLAEPGDVAHDPRRDVGFDVVNDLEFLGGGLEGEEVEGFLDADGEFERHVFELHLAGLDLGEIEDVVDDGEEGFAGGADGVDEVALLGVERGLHEEGCHADDAVHGRADFVRHRREELGLGAGSVVGLDLRAAEHLLGFDAGGDVGFDEDEVLELAGLVADGLDLEAKVVFAAGLGVVDDVGGEALALRHGETDTFDDGGVGVGPVHEIGGRFADDLVEGVFHDAGEALVDPLDGAVGGGDEDGVVGLGGDEGEFAGFGLGFAEGLFGFAAGGDVLDGADDAGGAAGGGGGDGFRTRVNPAVFAAFGSDAVFGFDERGDAAELGFDAAAVERKVVGVDEGLPGFDGGGHAAVVVAEHGPEAGAVVDVAGGDVPLEDADLGGVEGEAETFVGDLEAGFDAAAFFVFGLEFAVGELGGALTGAGAAGEVDAEAEEEGDAEAGAEGELGEEAAFVLQGFGGRRKGKTDTPVEDGVGFFDAESGGGRFAGKIGGFEDGLVADADLDVVVGAEFVVVDEAGEEGAVDVFAGDEAGGLAGAGDGRVDGDALAVEADVDRAGDVGRAVVAGAFDGLGASAVLRVIEGGGGGVFLRREGPDGAKVGVDDGDGDAAEIAGGVVPAFADVGFPDGFGIGGDAGPDTGEALDARGLAGEFVLDGVGEGFHRRLGLGREDGDFAFTQTDPENDGEGEAAHDGGHGRPRRRAAFGLHGFAPGEEEEGEADDQEGGGADGRGGGVGAPAVDGGEAGGVAEEGGETGGSGDRADDGLGEKSRARGATETAPDENERNEEDAGRRHRRHASGFGGFGEQVIGDEEFVDEQMDAENVFREGERGDGGGEQGEPGGAGEADIDAEKNETEDEDTEGVVGLDRGAGAERLNDGIETQPPAQEDDCTHSDQHGRDGQRRALEPGSSRQCWQVNHWGVYPS